MEQSAAKALDDIRVGGQHMILIAQQRLNEARTAMELGDFHAALIAAQHFTEKLTHLNHAQAHMGMLAESRLIKCSELRVGMVVPGVGPVTNIHPCEACDGDRPECTNVTFDLNGETMTMSGETEMIVQRDDAS